MEAANEKRNMEFKEKIEVAWYNANFQRADKLPKLDKLFKKNITDYDYDTVKNKINRELKAQGRSIPTVTQEELIKRAITEREKRERRDKRQKDVELKMPDFDDEDETRK